MATTAAHNRDGGHKQSATEQIGTPDKTMGIETAIRDKDKSWSLWSCDNVKRQRQIIKLKIKKLHKGLCLLTCTAG
jgi:hypothetical protein